MSRAALRQSYGQRRAPGSGKHHLVGFACLQTLQMSSTAVFLTLRSLVQQSAAVSFVSSGLDRVNGCN